MITFLQKKNLPATYLMDMNWKNKYLQQFRILSRKSNMGIAVTSILEW